jgi:predicted HicB family RNase H-like nuclease
MTTEILCFRATPDVRVQVDAAARAAGLSRNRWLRRTIDIALRRELRLLSRDTFRGAA